LAGLPINEVMAPGWCPARASSICLADQADLKLAAAAASSLNSAVLGSAPADEGLGERDRGEERASSMLRAGESRGLEVTEPESAVSLTRSDRASRAS